MSLLSSADAAILDAPPPPDTSAQVVAAPEFTSIVRDYAAMVYRTCFSVTRNSHDAEDAAQATFLSLSEQLRQGAQIRHLSSWLQQVARRTSLDLYRSRSRRRRREDAVRQTAERSTAPICAIDQAELAEIIRQELQHLPADYRTPLILHYYGELSTGQIARQLGCNAKALSMRLLRGRRMLAERLAGRGVVVGAAVLTAALVGVIKQNVALHVAAPAGVMFAPAMVAAVPDSLPPGFLLRLLESLCHRPRRAIFGMTLVAASVISGGGQYLSAMGRALDPSFLLRSIDSGIRQLIESVPLRPTAPLRLGGGSAPAPDAAATSEPPDGRAVAVAPVAVLPRPTFAPPMIHSPSVRQRSATIVPPHIAPPSAGAPSASSFNRVPDEPVAGAMDRRWTQREALVGPLRSKSGVAPQTVALLPVDPPAEEAVVDVIDPPLDPDMVLAGTEGDALADGRLAAGSGLVDGLFAGGISPDGGFAAATQGILNGLTADPSIRGTAAGTSAGIPEPALAPLTLAAAMLLRRRNR